MESMFAGVTRNPYSTDIAENHFIAICIPSALGRFYHAYEFGHKRKLIRFIRSRNINAPHQRSTKMRSGLLIRLYAFVMHFYPTTLQIHYR